MSINLAKEEQTESESNLIHTTFDFALYLELPQHTPQVGPLYFVGQNKNLSVTAYIAWWVIVSFTDMVSLSFRTVGQTRRSVNGFFGLRGTVKP